ncbi:uncharacterized protein MELLADRAFT_105307 [Melampsora larici-populina 98AG31]|uniref:Uncharacterized protein n=1 Tax=Melampsora larici-populina (strain 98AG31 / pathotype 3-4-7) TaxID=747676 RepID=F4RHP2_MELLP|nr:uncharacterized protein MELLADRAFT_105307 [Melampsora larici-populina 98AG31]EGG08096.1 hypothetical protein MELLADRAFT_105307 [Melampsora larici-populina 98AG31]
MAMPSTMQPEQNLSHKRQKTSESSLLATPTGVANVAQYRADHNPTKKWQAVLTRVIMKSSHGRNLCPIAMGHVYLIVLVFICQFSVFREVTNLFQVGYKA